MNIAAALRPDLCCCCCTSPLDEEVKDTPSAGYAGLSLLGIADCVTAPAHCTLLYIYIGFPVVFVSQTGTTSFEQLPASFPPQRHPKRHHLVRLHPDHRTHFPLHKARIHKAINFSAQIGTSDSGTRQHISSSLQMLRLVYKVTLIKFVDLLIKRIDFSETCYAH